MIKPRPATAQDVEALANLAELKRAEYARYEPEFWRPALSARLMHTPYLAWLVDQRDVAVFVAEGGDGLTGFITGRRTPAPPPLRFAGCVLHVDDFVVEGPGSGAETGRALLDACLAQQDASTPTRVLVVCGNRDRAKAQLLREAGLRAVCAFRLQRLGGTGGRPSDVRRATPDDSPAVAAMAERSTPHEHAMHLLWDRRPSLAGYRELLANPDLISVVAESQGRVVGYAIGRPGGPAPPVYDPGGTTCLVDEFALDDRDAWPESGAPLLAALEAAAGERGDVQLLVACGRDELQKRELLDRRRYRYPVDWYSVLLDDYQFSA